MIRHPEQYDDPNAPMVLFSPPMPVVPAIVVTRQNHRIATYFLELPRARYSILYSHANAVDIGGMAPALVQLASNLNCSILAYDYSGYGISSGKTRESNQYKDIDAAYDHLVTTLGVDPSKVLLYGQSIGTSPSTDKAARLGRAGAPLAGLILHSPMTSGIRILRPQCQTNICVDPFQNIKKIASVKAPCLILHGRRDQVIPFEHGETLHSLCTNPVEPLFLANATHDDIEAFPQYLPRLKQFLDEADAIARSLVP